MSAEEEKREEATISWADACLDEIKEAIAKLGIDCSKTPPMMYPEAILSAFAKQNTKMVAVKRKLRVIQQVALERGEKRDELEEDVAELRDVLAYLCSKVPSGKSATKEEYTAIIRAVYQAHAVLETTGDGENDYEQEKKRPMLPL